METSGLVGAAAEQDTMEVQNREGSAALGECAYEETETQVETVLESGHSAAQKKAEGLV